MPNGSVEPRPMPSDNAAGRRVAVGSTVRSRSRPRTRRRRASPTPRCRFVRRQTRVEEYRGHARAGVDGACQIILTIRVRKYHMRAGLRGRPACHRERGRSTSPGRVDHVAESPGKDSFFRKIRKHRLSRWKNHFCLDARESGRYFVCWLLLAKGNRGWLREPRRAHNRVAGAFFATAVR
jgi:hypothetical protein